LCSINGNDSYSHGGGNYNDWRRHGSGNSEGGVAADMVATVVAVGCREQQ